MYQSLIRSFLLQALIEESAFFKPKIKFGPWINANNVTIALANLSTLFCFKHVILKKQTFNTISPCNEESLIPTSNLKSWQLTFWIMTR